MRRTAINLGVVTVCGILLLHSGSALTAPEEPAPGASADPSAPPTEATAPAAQPDQSPDAELIRSVQHLPAAQGYTSLNAAGADFLVRYVSPEAPSAAGAVVVLAGAGTRITGLALIDALVDEFTLNDWAVMAVQSPLLPASAESAAYAELHPDITARLTSACEQLAADGITRVVVLGLADAAPLVQAFARDNPTAVPVRGIALSNWRGGELEDSPQPIVELASELDQAVRRAARTRHKEARRKARDYRLIVLPGLENTALFAAEQARRLRGWISATL